MESKRTIASLALLNANSRVRGRDFIDNFVPFLAALLRTKGYEYIDDIGPLSDDFQELFGLVVPYYPMQSIVNRARKHSWGIVSRQRGRFHVNADAAAKWDISPQATTQSRRMNAVIGQFCAYVKDRFSMLMTEADAEDALVDFLRHHDLDVLFASLGRSVLPDVKHSKKNRYMVSSFVHNVCGNDVEALSSLVGIALGHMLAAALLYEKTEAFVGKFDGVDVYLDTQFIFRLLGIEGNARKDACVSLVQTLRGHGAVLRVFTHTEAEALSILQGCANRIDQAGTEMLRPNSAFLFFHQRGDRAVDVERFIARVPEVFRSHAITVGDESNARGLQLYQIDEVKLKSMVIDTYKSRIPDFQEHERAFTVQRDVNSISATYRLRRGRTAVSIRGAGHIFLTTNTNLALASSKFDRETRPDDYGLPPCVTDVFIGTMIWMLNPMEAASLNMKRFIAECHAALQPDTALVQRVVREAEKLRREGRITPEQFQMVRGSEVARELLAERTLGDPDSFTEKTIPEVLAEMDRRAAEKGSKDYTEERQRHAETAVHLTGALGYIDAISGSIDARSKQYAQRISWCLFWALVAVFVLATCVGIFGTVFALPVRIACGIVSLATGAAGTVFGLDFWRVRCSATLWLTPRIRRFLDGGVGLPPTLPDHAQPDASVPNDREKEA